jgi:type 1 fimbria pilin
MNQVMFAKRFAFALLSMAALGSTALFAADEKGSAVLTVTGKLSPGACDVTVPDGGRIDFGIIPAPITPKDQYMRFDGPQKSLRVTCGGMMNAYVSVMDNNNDSAMKSPKAYLALGLNSFRQLFGMGAKDSNGDPIGSYTIAVAPATTTDRSGSVATQGAVIWSTDNRSTWTTSSTPVKMLGDGTGIYSTGASATGSMPITAKTFEFPLSVQAFIRGTKEAPIVTDVPLNGSATFSVAYN